MGRDGAKIVLPGVPRNVPLSGWANALLRKRTSDALLAVMAERAIDAS